MTSRTHRGFHRIGIVLAVPVLLVALWLAGHETWLQWTMKDPYAAFERVPEPKKPPNFFDQFDPPGKSTPDPFADLDARTPFYHADYTVASLALGLALALYVAARAIGWVLDGFVGPSRSA